MSESNDELSTVVLNDTSVQPWTPDAAQQAIHDRSMQIMDSRLEFLPEPTKVEMIGGGGTWGMHIDEQGKRSGEGKLGDAQLRTLQQEEGLFEVDLHTDRKIARQEIAAINRRLAMRIYQMFLEGLKQEAPMLKDQLDQWCKTRAGTISQYIEGPLHTLYSGDSSQLRPYLVAPIILSVLNRVLHAPFSPHILGMGTDTADLMTPTLDAFLFDANVAQVIVTGANHPHTANESDAPDNFMAAGMLAGKQLPSGAYYVFGRGENMFYGIDMVKLDPSEERRGGVEGQSTFFAPQRTNSKVQTILQYASNRPVTHERESSIPKDHVIRKMTLEDLYDAMSSIYVLDLGDQNAGEIVMDQIFDPSVKTIVVAGHSLGNADNEMRHYLVQAALAGKTVIVISRSLIGNTDDTYDAALLRENEPGGSLFQSGCEFIEGSKLNSAAARAIATRATIEGLSPSKLQDLVHAWCNARGIA